MKGEERKQDVAAEAIEDLGDAAGATLDDVGGGNLWEDIKQKSSTLPNLYTNPPKPPIGKCTQDPPPPLGPL